MSTTDTTIDPLRAFTTALTAAARSRLTIDYRVIALVRRAADQGRAPAELARTVGHGIGWRTPTNADQLMRFRLARECGALDDDQEDDD